MSTLIIILQIVLVVVGSGIAYVLSFGGFWRTVLAFTTVIFMGICFYLLDSWKDNLDNKYTVTFTIEIPTKSNPKQVKALMEYYLVLDGIPSDLVGVPYDVQDVVITNIKVK